MRRIMDIHPAIAEYKNHLLQAFPGRLQRFVIFGSYARGEQTTESDIDVLVSLQGPISTQDELNIYNSAFEIDLEYDVILDVKILNEDDFSSSMTQYMPFIENAMQEGISV